ncbi:MAG: flagellar filament capping protein FliD [Porticoccus sp.]
MLTATGIGSGLDIEGLVTQLVAAERSPADTRLTRQEITLTAELSAFGSFKGALSSFQSSLSSLNTLSTFGQRTATSSNEDIVTVSAEADAATSSYDLTVTQLANSHSLASDSYASVSDAVGTGTITIRFGTTDYTSPDPGPESYNSFAVNPERGVATINIDSSNNTLEGVRDAINDADIGVAAVIVNDGSGYRLLMSSESTGDENSLEISVDDTGDNNDIDSSGLSALAFNSSAINLTQTVAAQNAVFTINGLTISHSDNAANNVIDGVDITLKDVTSTEPVTVSVAEDRAGVKEAITDFVSSYNSFIETVNSLTAYDADIGSAGALQGDFSARSITSQLRQVLSNAVEGFKGPFDSLSEIGITTQSDGTLATDSGDLDAVLENYFDEVVGMFAAVGFSSDSNIGFVTSTEETVVGSHAINITQLSTKGQLLSAVATFPLDIDDDNDNFTLKVDGVTSGSISLTQGNYTSGAALAAELQSRINGDSALAGEGVTATVVFNVDHFEITSDRYGSASKVEVIAIDTNTTAELGFSIATGTNGLNVAGTIGGVAASGAGQTLSGALGSDAEGLALLIDGGTTGDRGTVDFSQGIAYQVNLMVTSFLESDGILDSRTDGLQDRIDDIGDQREVLSRRMESIEARYRAKFNALDMLLSRLQGTSNFLTQQLSSLPKPDSLASN